MSFDWSDIFQIYIQPELPVIFKGLFFWFICEENGIQNMLYSNVKFCFSSSNYKL